MTRYGIAIRQERALLPGLKAVRGISGVYGCYLLDVEQMAGGVRIRKPVQEDSCEDFGRAYGGRTEVEVPLQRFLYF